MLEIINETSQTVTTDENVDLGEVTIRDGQNRILYSNAESTTNPKTILITVPGKYKFSGVFNVINNNSAEANATIGLYAGDTNLQVSSITIPKPTGSGYGQIIINKTVVVKPTIVGEVAKLTFKGLQGGASVITSCVNVIKIGG